ncbi:MAG: hypothetical protein IPH18_02320 [Chitinophagaceae bacterium]|nr:hypothetical protein [Chitinophagaceae bacterium]MBK8951717.1 hypothetical protein [Chitinophagaceae bacterium]
MKQFLLSSALLYLLPLFSHTQEITGLWKGTMYNDSTKESMPYELLIKKDKSKLTGFTHSWFLIEGKEYYGIKKVKVSVARDGKIVIKDDELIENNYPVLPDKNVHQLNVLDLVNNENENVLDGPFVTNTTRKFMELTGHISIKRVSTFTESSLMQYFKKKGVENEVAVIH